MICSPDGAKRNPGSFVPRETRIALRSIRATRFAAVVLLAFGWPAVAQVDYPQAEIGGEVVGASVATENVELRLSIEPNPEIAGHGKPVLEVIWGGESVAKIASEAGMAAFPSTAGLVEMDPANDTLEVFFETYTGGAHCCTELRVLSRSASGKWKTLDVGAFNGGGGLVDDLDGDGRYEIASADEAFLYAFGCYACSAAPLQVSSIQSGEVRDATFEPRFQEKHREYLAQLEEELDMSQAENGFLAGWLAQKAIVGEGEAAWADMLMAYDREDDWGLAFCPDGTTDCPEEDLESRPFPEVLKEFLDERGYPL